MKDSVEPASSMEDKMLGGFSIDCNEIRSEYELYFMNVLVHTIRTYPFVVMGSIALISFLIGAIVMIICFNWCYRSKCKTPRLVREQKEVATQLL